jgi:hypothetical protein
MKIRDGKIAHKNATFCDGSSNWVIYNADGSTFATAYYDAACDLWQVFQNESVGAGRTIDAAIFDVHEI